MRTIILTVLAFVLTVGCSASVVPSEDVRCERTAEDAAGTCALDVGPGYVCGGEGFVACEPGSEHCVCNVGPDGVGVCGAATCVPAAPACEPASFETAEGDVREIHPDYIAHFGCETFEGMTTAADFSDFCAVYQDGDGAISTDTLPGCRVGTDSCERFWVCDNGFPAE